MKINENIKEFLKCLIKSVHFWIWIAFILWTIFCYYYPREWAVYDNTNFNLDEVFAPIQWYFIWMMGVAFWGAIYNTLTD